MSTTKLNQKELEECQNNEIMSSKIKRIYQEENKKYYITYFVGVQFILDSGWRLYRVYNLEKPQVKFFDTVEEAEAILKELDDNTYPKLIKEFQ